MRLIEEGAYRQAEYFAAMEFERNGDRTFICGFGISYRQLAEMVNERGWDVHYTTVYRWVPGLIPSAERR